MPLLQRVFQIPMPLVYSENEEDSFVTIEGIKFMKMDNLAGYMEIFSRRDYEFGGFTDCVFIDVGANTADSTLYAAAQPHISKVYAYEPFPQVYELASMNIELNRKLSKKIELVNKGWFNEDKTMEIPETDDINHSAVNSVLDEFLEKTPRQRDHLAEVELIRASDELKKILKKHPNNPIVLKMDIEGSEYACVRDIDEQGLFENIDVVLMEWHMQGYKPITDILEKYNFIWFNENLSNATGFLRAYRRR